MNNDVDSHELVSQSSTPMRRLLGRRLGAFADRLPKRKNDQPDDGADIAAIEADGESVGDPQVIRAVGTRIGGL